MRFVDSNHDATLLPSRPMAQRGEPTSSSNSPISTSGYYLNFTIKVHHFVRATRFMMMLFFKSMYPGLVVYWNMSSFPTSSSLAFIGFVS